MTAATTGWTDPADVVDVAAAVMAAAAEQWPTLGVDDLSTIHAWATNHAGHGTSTLVDHLTKDAHADPRVQVALRIAAPLPAAEGNGAERGVVTAITCQVPHDLIAHADLPDAALQLWLLMGTLPPLNREHRPVMWWWLAERGGEQWSGLSEESVKKRIRRSAADLAAVGALSVQTEQLGSGRSRSLYQRLRLPAKNRFEIVSLKVVQTLSPQLLRAYLRWLQVMGHRRHTRQSLTALAARWGISRDQARRQRQALVQVGLLEAADGYVALPGESPVENTPDPSYPQPPAEPEGGATFSSGGCDILVRPYKEEKNREEIHPFGTLVPRTQVAPERGTDPEPIDDPPVRLQPSVPAAAPPTQEQSPNPDLPAAAAVPAQRSRSKPAPTNTCWGEAGRIVSGVRWLAVAPERVRAQARTVIAGLLKHLPEEITAADVKRAIDTIDPGEPTTEHVRLIRAAVSGLHADLKATTTTASTDAPPLRAATTEPNQPMTVATTAGARPGTQGRTEPEQVHSSGDSLEVFRRPADDIDWTDPDLAEETVFDWLCVLYVRHLDAHGPAVLATLRTVAQRQIPQQWSETAAAAADTIAALTSPRKAG